MSNPVFRVGNIENAKHAVMGLYDMGGEVIYREDLGAVAVSTEYDTNLMSGDEFLDDITKQVRNILREKDVHYPAQFLAAYYNSKEGHPPAWFLPAAVKGLPQTGDIYDQFIERDINELRRLIQEELA